MEFPFSRVGFHERWNVLLLVSPALGSVALEKISDGDTPAAFHLSKEERNITR